MKCAIIGSSVFPDGISQEYLTKLENFGKWLADNNIEVLTGACGGFPYIIGKSCVEHGGFVKGFSPATNSYEHKNSYKHPLDGCSIIKYLDSESKNLTSRFLIRSIPLIEEANIIVSIAGNWGTLNELTVGIITGKKLIVLMDSGGISSTFYKLYHSLLSEYDYNYGESVDFVDSVEDLCLYLLKNNR